MIFYKIGPHFQVDIKFIKADCSGFLCREQRWDSDGAALICRWFWAVRLSSNTVSTRRPQAQNHSTGLTAARPHRALSTGGLWSAGALESSPCRYKGSKHCLLLLDEHRVITTYQCLFTFLSALFYCTNILPPWLSLFQSIFFFLMLLRMELCS